MAVAGTAVVVVALTLIPGRSTAALLLLNIASINMGVFGFMSYLGIRLDFISLTAIVMSIGFSSDYTSHLAYIHSTDHDGPSGCKLERLLSVVGPPILQSTASTALGVSFVAFTDSYVFRSFLITILLVVALSAVHSLVLFPVMLDLVQTRAVTQAIDISQPVSSCGRRSTTSGTTVSTTPSESRFYSF